MSHYVFQGYPAFVESAAAELGRPESAGPARRIAPLTALANLCAQAAEADPASVEGILAKAAEFRDQIATALRAADLILVDIAVGLQTRSLSEAESETESLTDFGAFPSPRAGRKGPRTSREIS